jgi:hypothetical protein
MQTEDGIMRHVVDDGEIVELSRPTEIIAIFNKF